MSSSRPVLLFYCQHAVGMGHLVRSLALAAALADRFRVVFLSGGRMPRGLPLPRDVEVRALPPLALGPDNRLISCDRRRGVERAQQVRREQILAAFEQLQPAAIVVELFPFGRKKFAPELLPLLERARRPGSRRPLVICSLRDILVGRPGDQRSHDERAVNWANTYFDAVLVHADPRVARLEDTFQPATPLRIPVEYTGFVLGEPACEHSRARAGNRRVIVSAGGGLVGEPLFRAALEAQQPLWASERLETHIVTGPFLPDSAWQSLRAAAAQRPGLRLRRFVPDLRAQMRASVASVSQCGYNTALDLLWSGVPSLVVPYAEGAEDEQTRRARRLEALGAVRVLPADRLDGPTLAREVRALLEFQPAPLAIDLDGARNTTRLLEDLLDGLASGRGRQRR
jgi:predicted glycosyltransferase